MADKPIYVFETGGTTGIPKSRIAIEDFRTDYSLFSETLPEKYFPHGANWLMLGPSGPRRLRLAVEHLAQHRGGICFCIDLDPRWVIKLIKKGWMEHLEAYKQHCIDQAMTILAPATTSSACSPRRSCSKRCAWRWKSTAAALQDTGITGIFSGGTEFTPQWTRFCVEELFGGPPEDERHLHDADLRQHADGPGLLASPSPPPTATRLATTPRSRGPSSKSSISTTRTASSATAKPAARN